MLAYSIFLVVMLAILAFYNYRNNWVRHQRIKLLRQDPEAYMRLPSYNYMLDRFWIWDIRKFIKDPEQ